MSEYTVENRDFIACFPRPELAALAAAMELAAGAEGMRVEARHEGGPPVAGRFVTTKRAMRQARGLLRQARTFWSLLRQQQRH